MYFLRRCSTSLCTCHSFSPRAVLNGKKNLFRYAVFPKKPAGTPCVGGWRLAAVGGWWRLAVGGGWRLMAVGGGWWLAVDGLLGRSLRAVLNKKKTSSLRTPLFSPLEIQIRSDPLT